MALVSQTIDTEGADRAAILRYRLAQAATLSENLKISASFRQRSKKTSKPSAGMRLRFEDSRSLAGLQLADTVAYVIRAAILHPTTRWPSSRSR